MKWTKGKNYARSRGYINGQIKWEAADMHHYKSVGLVEDAASHKCVEAKGWRMMPGPVLEPYFQDITKRLVGLPINMAVALFETYAKLEELDFE